MTDDRISKTMAFVLRHEALKLGLDVVEGGYVTVSSFLELPIMCGATEATVKKIVESDKKGRYSFSQDGKMIRANQGHSFPVPGEHQLLNKVTEPAQIPVCVHGTYRQHLVSIMQNGLNRMGRQHIHFASGMRAKSGMRGDCNVQIFIDVEKAMADGCPFYTSTNGVILSPGFGDTGTIPSTYFKKVSTREGESLETFFP